MASNKAPWDRGTASYKCRKCKKEWIRRESTGQPDTCPSCGERGVKPYRFKRKGRRMFGEFECSCGNTWSSGNAWEGMGQQCRDCKEMILPRTLQPLRRSEGSGGGAHEQELCEMCQEIGGNCRELEENNSDDDAESVVSTISTVSSAGTVTPGEEYSEESGSSGSDTEDELADNLRRLTFPK